MLRSTRSLLLAALLLTTGCENQFDIAQKAHTIEAYEKYLQKCHEVRADDVRAGVETTRFSQHGHVVAEK